MSRIRHCMWFVATALAVTGVAAIPAVLPARASAASTFTADGAPWLQPPDGVFTCSWINAHPAAAIQWRVSCDSAGPAEPLGASASALPSAEVTPLANGCEWLPDVSHYVGQGVFAWSTYEYASQWTWNAYTNPPGGILWYHWYLQKTDGTNYANNTSTSSSGSVYPPANIYRWGAQNTNGNPTQWLVCYQG